MLQKVIIRKDELEALRLQNLEGLEQIEAAKQTQISQPTFHRIVTEAKTKITGALVTGKAIKIEQ